MRYSMRWLLPLIVLLGMSLPTFAQENLSNEQINEISNAVVQIVGYCDGEEISSGSGTFVSENGLIYTNRHVLEGVDEYAIYTLGDPDELPQLSYYAEPQVIFPYETDNGTMLDFATLQVNRDADGNALLPTNINVPFVDMSTYSEAQRGESIYVFGYPGIGEGYLVFTDGIVTTVQNADVGDERMAVWYQTSAEIASGNSGGLAVNAAGEPIGIPTAANSDRQVAISLGGLLPLDFIQTAANGGIRPSATDELAGCGESSAASGNFGGQSSEDVSVAITNVDVDASAGYVSIDTRIDIQNHADDNLIATAYFYWFEEDNVVSVPAQLELYALDDGSLFFLQTFSPDSDDVVLDGVTLNVPMDAFPTVADERNVGVVVDITDEDFSMLASSEPALFSFSNVGSTQETATRIYEGVDLTCPDGQEIVDGVEIEVFQMRPGFEYTATVIGLDDFDPVLAVVPTENLNSGMAELCNDDGDDVSGYSVSLPTTGNVSANSLSSQLVFSHSSNDLMSISLIVGEYDRNAGEFVLILEGMAATAADVIGDPFIFRLSPNVNASEQGITTYMIGRDASLDPLFFIGNPQDPTTPLSSGNQTFECDDAGNARNCYQTGTSLVGSQVVLGGDRVIEADEQDAMLSAVFNLDDLETMDDALILPYIMRSYEQISTGRYIIVFHVGME